MILSLVWAFKMHHLGCLEVTWGACGSCLELRLGLISETLPETVSETVCCDSEVIWS